MFRIIFVIIAKEMKLTAIILILGMLLPFADRMANVYEINRPESELCCHTTAQALPHHSDKHHEKDGHNDHMCLPGCHCYCCFHMIAIEYLFHASPEILDRPFHYIVYRNDYYFDFYTPVFEPPRLG
jgi:hypothetical protein